jgi:hypothetical protein
VTLSRGRGVAGIKVVQGASEEAPTIAEILIEEGASTVYVFVREIDARELAPVLQAMFDRTGPSVLEVFSDDIETLYFNEEHR